MQACNLHPGGGKYIDKDVDEFVDFVQFAVLNAETRQPVINMATGEPVRFGMSGDATDWTNNYANQFFGVEQDGGWFTSYPPKITTFQGIDPTLAILLAHMCVKEFSTAAIKDNFHPNFPYDPFGCSWGWF